MKRTPLNKVSKSPIRKLKKKLLEDVKLLIRTSGPCAAAGMGGKSCGGYLQASHIKSEGAYKNLFVDPQNILPMCWTHHFFWWHKEPTEAAEWFKKIYPKRYAYLEKAKRVHVDFTPAKIEALHKAVKRGYEEYARAYGAIVSVRTF